MQLKKRGDPISLDSLDSLDSLPISIAFAAAGAPRSAVLNETALGMTAYSTTQLFLVMSCHDPKLLLAMRMCISSRQTSLSPFFLKIIC